MMTGPPRRIGRIPNLSNTRTAPATPSEPNTSACLIDLVTLVNIPGSPPGARDDCRISAVAGCGSPPFTAPTVYRYTGAMSQDLYNNFPQAGKLEWIGVRRKKRGRVDSLDSTQAQLGQGLEGDHRTAGPARSTSKRQVTLIQAEHLPVIAVLAGRDHLDPAEMRRNLVISGINLTALKDKRFSIGEVLFEGSGACPPCSRMEEALGEGGLNAMRGHGGITARVVEPGALQVGDEVRVQPSEPSEKA